MRGSCCRRRTATGATFRRWVQGAAAVEEEAAAIGTTTTVATTTRRPPLDTLSTLPNSRPTVHRQWTSLHVNAASEGDVSISGEDPTDLAFDLFTNLCKIQSVRSTSKRPKNCARVSPLSSLS